MKKRIKLNKYVVNTTKAGGLVFTALKTLANNKKRTDKATLSRSEVNELKRAKSKDAFFSLVDKYIVDRAKIGSAAKRAGQTLNTGYDAAHYRVAKELGLAKIVA
jgi:hypothetical protein